MKALRKNVLATLLCASASMTAMAQGWPASYEGVMLQGFAWDSYADTQWKNLESQADELSDYFSLVWVPQSGKCLETYNVMGYTPYYYFNHNSSFGSETELRSMISTFKQKGLGVIADVVINHHNTTGWFGFPAETYKGVTYQLQSTDITADDDGGATATEAKKQGVSLSSNKDEGEDWSSMRDLDHKSANVQKVVKAYEDFLVNDLGYTGFRYDMVKGFDGSHVADYNKAAGVKYSVGEYWDSNAKIEKWIDATDKQSAAFDFQFRYNVRDAINNADWSQLNSTNNLVHDNAYKQYAVTFVENHDTQYRNASEPLDPIRKDTLAANAYLLAMPGTPCVFLPHWQAYKREIKAMIQLRHLAGVTNTSEYQAYRNTKNYYGVLVQGNNAKLLAVMGQGMADPDASLYVKVLSGYHYAYYLSTQANTTWVDLPSGTYTEGNPTATLMAVTADDAPLVYTLDGTEPTANSAKVASGYKLQIPDGETTLKVGMLVGGVVKAVTTRHYVVKQFEPYQITVYVNTDKVGWDSYVNYHSWGGSNTGTSWPGAKVTATTTIDGKKWFYNSYTMNKADDAINFVFSIGTSSTASNNQTVDVNGVNKDTFFEISNEKEGTKYKVNDVSSTTDISSVTITLPTSADPYYYTLSGQRVLHPTQSGIYIHQGKKIAITR